MLTSSEQNWSDVIKHISKKKEKPSFSDVEMAVKIGDKHKGTPIKEKTKEETSTELDLIFSRQRTPYPDLDRYITSEELQAIFSPPTMQYEQEWFNTYFHNLADFDKNDLHTIFAESIGKSRQEAKTIFFQNCYSIPWVRMLSESPVYPARFFE